jgi:hypothetical protein
MPSTHARRARQRHSTFFEYAVPLTKRTYPRIIAYAEAFDYHLAQEFDSILNTEIIDLCVSMVFDVTIGRPVEFHVFPAATLDACWHYGDGVRGPFTRIIKNTY